MMGQRSMEKVTGQPGTLDRIFSYGGLAQGTQTVSKPLSSCFNGSGLPIPEKGSR